MNRNLLIAAGALAAVLLVVLMSALFTVHQTQQALVLQFGNPKRVITEAGLHAKLPFIQNAIYIDRRVLDFDAESQEVILGDQKRLVVDAFARYKIIDPLRFYQSVGSEGVLRGRIDTILDASLRKVLGEVPLFTVLSADRAALMNSIRDQANTEAKQFGIDIVDVRIKRADLPAENSQAIYRRMQTEREREAKELRAQGAELAQRIRSRADRERRVIIAEAEKEGQIIRGEGDAQAIRIFAEAFGQDVDFFTFYRSMQAYRDALGDDNTSFVLSPDSEFFRFFNDPATALQTARGARDATVDAMAGDLAAQPEALPGATVGADSAPGATAVE
ncbi:MAG TPA: protease modulator HflC [Geminicoccaceae bacterium]|nr:protease modulator HflC [Geminicoccaceae bacterium]